MSKSASLRAVSSTSWKPTDHFNSYKKTERAYSAKVATKAGSDSIIRHLSFAIRHSLEVYP